MPPAEHLHPYAPTRLAAVRAHHTAGSRCSGGSSECSWPSPSCFIDSMRMQRCATAAAGTTRKTCERAPSRKLHDGPEIGRAQRVEPKRTSAPRNNTGVQPGLHSGCGRIVCSVSCSPPEWTKLSQPRALHPAQRDIIYSAREGSRWSPYASPCTKPTLASTTSVPALGSIFNSLSTGVMATSKRLDCCC
jgi:hypothetical protein